MSLIRVLSFKEEKVLTKTKASVNEQDEIENS